MADKPKSNQAKRAEYRSNMLFGGNRELVIQRDGERCVRCGMTRDEHKERFGNDITVDHIDGRGKGVPVHMKNNDPSNLQTLCLPCHSSKDNRARKLTDIQVINIRHAQGAISSRKLGKLYGISAVYVRMLWRNEWRKSND